MAVLRHAMLRQQQMLCAATAVASMPLTPSSVVVGSALSCGTCVRLLAAKMVVLKPAGPSVP
jgi:hypothetical protein